MTWLVRLAALLALWLATATVFAIPAEARVVGIVFDDFGSMVSRIQVPTFGAQLLVSTLDGHADQDRLFTLRLSQVLAALGSHGQLTNLPPGGVTADSVRGWLAQARAPALTEVPLASQAQQQAVLVILTDGKFEPDPDAARAAGSFRRYAERLAAIRPPAATK